MNAVSEALAQCAEAERGVIEAEAVYFTARRALVAARENRDSAFTALTTAAREVVGAMVTGSVQ